MTIPDPSLLALLRAAKRMAHPLAALARTDGSEEAALAELLEMLRRDGWDVRQVLGVSEGGFWP